MGIETAIIGSAVLGAGASLAGASKASKAAKQAAAAQSDAAQKQVDLSREIYYDQRGLSMPYYSAGLQGLYGDSGVMALMGMSQPENTNAFASGSYGSQPIGQPTPTSGPDYSSYVTGNQGLNNAFSSLRPQDIASLRKGGYDANNDGQISADEYGKFHYTKYGQAEGRSLPQYSAPANAFSGSSGQSTGQVGTAQPVNDNPAASSGEGSMTTALRSTPGYAFLQDEAKRNLENSFASRGKLLSGSAMRALNEQTIGLADQQYQSSLSNAFRLASLGTGAAGAIQNAGTNYGNSAGNAFAQMGQAAANSAYGKSNAWNQGMQGVSDAIMGGVGAYGAYGGWGNPASTAAAAVPSGTLNMGNLNYGWG